jgi:hypothetical protein
MAKQPAEPVRQEIKITCGPIRVIPKAPKEFQKGVPDNWVPMEKYCHGHQLDNKLAFLPEFDNSIYAFRFFRAEDEIPKLDGSMECGYWNVVHRSLELLNHTMDKVFLGDDEPGCPWDASGFYPRGRNIKTPDGRECCELYLAVRPAQVNAAEQAIRVQESVAKLDKDSAELQGAAQAATITDPNNPNSLLLQAKVHGAQGRGWNQFSGFNVGQDPLATQKPQN